MGILLSREFYLGYFCPFVPLFYPCLEAREFVRFTIFFFYLNKGGFCILSMIICRLGSFEILELLHSFMGSTSLNLCVSLCLCLLWRDIQGILIEGIFIRFFSYSSYSGLFLDGKTREFVRFDSKMEEGGCF